VILEGDGRAEEGHDAVAEELVHGAVIAVDDVGDEPQDAVHQCVQRLRVQALGEAGGIGHVGEEHGDLLALVLQLASIAQDPLGEVARGVVALRGRLRDPRGARRAPLGGSLPHEDPPHLVGGEPLGVDELRLEILDVVVVQREAALERAV
jgi:hypothetical protein